jgi:hypothetical protein
LDILNGDSKLFKRSMDRSTFPIQCKRQAISFAVFSTISGESLHFSNILNAVSIDISSPERLSGVDMDVSGLTLRLDPGVNTGMYSNNNRQIATEAKKMSAQPRSSVIQQLVAIFDNQSRSSEPLLSPANICLLAECFDIQLSRGKNPQSLVRTLKYWLKRLSLTATINSETVQLLRSHIDYSFHFIRTSPVSHPCTVIASPEALLKDILNGSTVCLSCEINKPFIFCRTCRDLFCPICYDRVHRKGNRSRHKQLSLLRCSYTDVCGHYAVVQCQLSGRVFCPECYLKSYISQLPMTDRKPPIRISYGPIWDSDASTVSFKSPPVNDLTSDWHPFYDRDGLLFYYNFSTRGSRRRIPLSSFDDEEPVAEENSDVSKRVCKLKPLYFSSPFPT